MLRGILAAMLCWAIYIADGKHFFEADAQSPSRSVVHFDGPKLRFHNGQVSGSRAATFPEMPDVDGPPSQWTLMQWNKGELLNPTVMLRHDNAYRDPKYGAADYTFATQSLESRLSIFNKAAGPVFELAASGGSLTNTGGSNLFLQYDRIAPELALNREVTYTLKLKMIEASVEATPQARQRGGVLAQVLSGFSIAYVSPEGSHKQIPVFLQLDHSNSNDADDEYRGCFAERENQNIVYNAAGDISKRIPFSPGEERELSFSISSLVCELVRKQFACQDNRGKIEQFVFPRDANDLSRWRMRSMYVGLETEDRDLRPNSLNRARQGDVQVSVQISDLNLSVSGKAAACDGERIGR